MWERSLGFLGCPQGTCLREPTGIKKSGQKEDVKLGALLLDLQGLKGELLHIMPGG